MPGLSEAQRRRTARNLAGLDEQERARVDRFLAAANKHLRGRKMSAVIVAGKRSREQQEELRRKAEAGGPKAAPAKYSPHEYGLGFDIALIGDDGSHIQDQKILEELGTIGEGEGLRWGGRFGDPPHYESVRWEGEVKPRLQAMENIAVLGTPPPVGGKKPLPLKTARATLPAAMPPLPSDPLGGSPPLSPGTAAPVGLPGTPPPVGGAVSAPPPNKLVLNQATLEGGGGDILDIIRRMEATKAADPSAVPGLAQKAKERLAGMKVEEAAVAGARQRERAFPGQRPRYREDIAQVPGAAIRGPEPIRRALAGLGKGVEATREAVSAVATDITYDLIKRFRFSPRRGQEPTIETQQALEEATLGFIDPAKRTPPGEPQPTLTEAAERFGPEMAPGERGIANFAVALGPGFADFIAHVGRAVEESGAEAVQGRPMDAAANLGKVLVLEPFMGILETVKNVAADPTMLYEKPADVIFGILGPFLILHGMKRGMQRGVIEPMVMRASERLARNEKINPVVEELAQSFSREVMDRVQTGFDETALAAVRGDIAEDIETVGTLLERQTQATLDAAAGRYAETRAAKPTELPTPPELKPERPGAEPPPPAPRPRLEPRAEERPAKAAEAPKTKPTTPSAPAKAPVPAAERGPRPTVTTWETVDLASRDFQQVEAPVAELNLAPEKLQYKVDVDVEGKVPGHFLFQKGARFERGLADPIRIWKDPESGKWYVVDGHQRFIKARQDQVETIQAVVVPNATVKTFADARAYGALKNIAAQSGKAVDVATFLRDSEIGPEGLEKAGISPESRFVKQGQALANLDDFLFSQVARGEFPLERAAIIGEKLPNHADQRALVALLEKQAKRRPVTNDLVSALADKVAGAERTTETQAGLFGKTEVEQNLAVEQAALEAALARQLKKRKAKLGEAAKPAVADILEEAGSVIERERTRGLSIEAAENVAVFEKVKDLSGPLNDAIREGAQAIAGGKNEQAVLKDLYSRIGDLVDETLSGRPRAGEKGPPAREGAQPALELTEPGDRIRQVGAALKQETLDLGESPESGALRVRLPGRKRGTPKPPEEARPDFATDQGKDFIDRNETAPTRSTDPFFESIRKSLQTFSALKRPENRVFFANSVEKLRQGMTALKDSRYEAVELLGSVVKGLDIAQMDVMRRYVIFRDLAETGEKFAKDTGLTIEEIAEGLSMEDVRAELSKHQPLVDADPALKAAIDRHDRLVTATREELVRRGKLDAEAGYEYYFPHIVLKHYRAGKGRGGGRRLEEPRRGYVKQRQDIKAVGQERPSPAPFWTDYVEAMYESLSQVIRDNLIDDVIKNAAEAYDLRVRTPKGLEGWVKDMQAKEKFDPAKDPLPPGYVAWQPLPGIHFYPRGILGAAEATKVVEYLLARPDIITPMGVDFRAVRSLFSKAMQEKQAKKPAFVAGGRRRTLILPEELAEVLDNYKADYFYNPTGNVANFVRGWKSFVLKKNPIRYNRRNFMGDAERMLASQGFAPFRHIPQAVRDTLAARRGDVAALKSTELGTWHQIAQEKAVIGSGRVATEVGKIRQAPQLRHLLEGGPMEQILNPRQALRNLSQWIGEMSEMREDVLRLAVLYDNLTRIEAGKPLNTGISDVRGLTDPVDAAAKIARETLGDYGNFTPFGNKLRNGVMPFYSWVQINTHFWGRLAAAQGPKGIAKRLGTMGARQALRARTWTILGSAYLATAFWNEIVNEELERDTPDYIRNQWHLQTGQRDPATGAPIVITDPTALDDFFRLLGVQGVTANARRVLRGQMTVQEFLDAEQDDLTVHGFVPRPLAELGSRLGPPTSTAITAIFGVKSFPSVQFIGRDWKKMAKEMINTIGLNELTRHGLPGIETPVGEWLSKSFMSYLKDLNPVPIGGLPGGEPRGRVPRDRYYELRETAYDKQRRLNSVALEHGKAAARTFADTNYRALASLQGFRDTERELTKLREQMNRRELTAEQRQAVRNQMDAAIVRMVQWYEKLPLRTK